MKKLLVIALALFTLQVTAQDKKEDRKELRKERMEKMQNMDAKDIAQLQTKKMTLALDLTDQQQKEVGKLNLKNAQLRKAGLEKRKEARKSGQKPTQEEHLKMANEKLDAQIATKRAMKKILTPEQYAKFEKIAAKRMKKGKEKGQRKKGMKRRADKKS